MTYSASSAWLTLLTSLFFHFLLFVAAPITLSLVVLGAVPPKRTRLRDALKVLAVGVTTIALGWYVYKLYRVFG
jgi:hypothetical protein